MANPNPGVHVFDKMLAQANQWVLEVGEEMGNRDPQAAYHAMRGTFFALRDRLPTEDTAHLSAQLPTLLRGVFYDGYRAADKPVLMNRGQFLQRARHEIGLAGDNDAERAVGAVLRVMERRLDKDEMDKVRRLMPKDIRALWPDAAPAAELRQTPRTTGLNPGDVAAPGTPGTGENLCPDCSGKGRIRGKECPTCGGTGKVIEGIGGA